MYMFPQSFTRLFAKVRTKVESTRYVCVCVYVCIIFRFVEEPQMKYINQLKNRYVLKTNFKTFERRILQLCTLNINYNLLIRS